MLELKLERNRSNPKRYVRLISYDTSIWPGVVDSLPMGSLQPMGLRLELDGTLAGKPIPWDVIDREIETEDVTRAGWSESHRRERRMTRDRLIDQGLLIPKAEVKYLAIDQKGIDMAQRVINGEVDPTPDGWGFEDEPLPYGD